MPIRLILAALFVALAMGRSVAADTPAPPLDMREYQAFLRIKPGNGSAEIAMKIPTKLLGTMWFPGSSVFLTLDTAYSRWAVDAYCKFYVLETPTIPPIDKALFDDHYIVKQTVDADSVLRLPHLKQTHYLVYGGFELYTGKAIDEFRSVAGTNENGGSDTASVPTLSFPKVDHEALCVMAEIEIDSDTTALKLRPTVVKDVLLK